ncbi:MAG: hypothetical protein AAGH74_11760 [Pseudomonadota bacterium]
MVWRLNWITLVLSGLLMIGGAFLALVASLSLPTETQLLGYESPPRAVILENGALFAVPAQYQTKLSLLLGLIAISTGLFIADFALPRRSRVRESSLRHHEPSIVVDVSRRWRLATVAIGLLLIVFGAHVLHEGWTLLIIQTHIIDYGITQSHVPEVNALFVFPWSGQAKYGFLLGSIAIFLGVLIATFTLGRRNLKGAS